MASKKRKKAGKKSRGKGKRGEYKIRDALKAWWGGEFHTTPGSGAFATRTSADYRVCGDVSTPDESFPFCVESKNCEGWNLEQLLTAPKCDIYAWWDQAVEQTPEGDIPLLIFTRNYQPLFYVIRVYDALTKLKTSANVMTLKMRDGEIVLIGLFDEFTSLTSKEDWKLNQ